MCQFKSAIIVNTSAEPIGFDLLHNPWTDSHEDLVRLFKLNDKPTPSGEPRFARVEYRPNYTRELADISKFNLILDEQRAPSWWTPEKAKKVEAKMRAIVEAMIVSGDADLLCGDAFILAKGAKVATVKNAIIHVMMPGSNVGEMRESSKVGEMRESSKVGVMWESSKVGEMWGSSKVGEMWGSSNVGVMRESSKVEKDNRIVKGDSK
jgi:hypothetical protein